MHRDKIEVKYSSIDNKGVFATEDIPEGVDIIQYTGRKLTKAQAERSGSLYLFDLNSKITIDGRNIARYINHSCDPNCEADVKKGQIWISSIRPIKKGEELAYNYHYDYEEGLQFPCRCGYRRCAGYIMAPENWKKIKKKQKKVEV